MKKLYVLLLVVQGLFILTANAQFDGEKAVFLMVNVPGNGSEVAVEQRLKELGMEVVMFAQHEANDEVAAGGDLLLISSTVGSPQLFGVLPGLASYEIPVISWEPALFDEMGFSAKGGWGIGAVEGKITIVDPEHQMAAGLDGDVVVASAQATLFGGGVPEGDVEIVARSFTNADTAVIFCYEEGASMATGTAPARRVGFFFLDEVAEYLTDEGWALFDAAVQWAMGLLPETSVISNKSQHSEISVYPNPSSGIFELRFVSNYFQKVEIHITNVTGQEVLHRVFTANYGTNYFSFDASELKEGLYFYSVLMRDQIAGGKILITE